MELSPPSSSWLLSSFVKSRRFVKEEKEEGNSGDGGRTSSINAGTRATLVASSLQFRSNEMDPLMMETENDTISKHDVDHNDDGNTINQQQHQVAKTSKSTNNIAPQQEQRRRRRLDPPPTFSFLDLMSLSHGPSDAIPFTWRTWLGFVASFAMMFLPVLLYQIRDLENSRSALDYLLVITLGPLLIGIPCIVYHIRSFYRLGPVPYMENQLAIFRCWYGAESRFLAVGIFQLGMYYECIVQDYDQALACYRRITTEFAACRTQPSTAPYHAKVGNILYAMGRYPEALEAFETCLALRRKSNSVDDGVNSGAITSTPTSRIGRAWKTFADYIMKNHSSSRSSSSAPFSLRVQTDLHSMGQVYEQMGQLPTALEIFQEAQATLLENGGHEKSLEHAKSLLHMARVLSKMDNNDKSVSSKVINNDGNNAIKKSNFDESLEMYEQALAIHLYNVGEYPRSASVAAIYTSMADLYVQRSEAQKATEHYNLAVEVHRRAGHSDDHRLVASILRKLAELKYDSALNQV